ncbi:MAG: hypothetical protein WC100_05150 [Sterolibacterium sp.]
MKNRRLIAQPLLGSIGLVVTVGFALLVCVAFDARTFATWVAFLIMSIVPAQTIMDLVWKNSYPPALMRLPQPFKGIVILASLAVVGCVIVPLTLKLVGGSVTPPIPFLNIYMILSILATFWLVAVFQCWPFSAISAKPTVIGVGTMVLAYLLAWWIFNAGFDFGVMEKAPFYLASLDPHGAFPVWSIFSYLVTTVAVIMALVLFDFWSFTGPSEKSTQLTRQPLFGLLVGLFVLIASALIWTAGVHWVGMDRVDFMVRIPISFLLGNFILLLLFQTAPFHKMAQPVKGILLNVFSAVLAVLAYSMYRYVALAVVGDLPAGPPTYTLDLWVAAAMLSVTLPVIVAYAGALECWPFSS